MSAVFGHASEAAEFLRGRMDPIPEVAIVLGSGLGAFGDGLQDATTIAYSFIPHWPVTGGCWPVQRNFSAVGCRTGEGSRVFQERGPSAGPV